MGNLRRGFDVDARSARGVALMLTLASSAALAAHHYMVATEGRFFVAVAIPAVVLPISLVGLFWPGVLVAAGLRSTSRREKLASFLLLLVGVGFAWYLAFVAYRSDGACVDRGSEHNVSSTSEGSPSKSG